MNNFGCGVRIASMWGATTPVAVPRWLQGQRFWHPAFFPMLQMRISAARILFLTLLALSPRMFGQTCTFTTFAAQRGDGAFRWLAGLPGLVWISTRRPLLIPLPDPTP